MLKGIRKKWETMGNISGNNFGFPLKGKQWETKNVSRLKDINYLI